MITKTLLRKILKYDADSGAFVWRQVRSNRVKVGNKAGRLDSRGYIAIQIDGQSYQAHRLAWLYIFGRMSAAHIDHADRNRANNAITNLREATRSQNGANRATPLNNKSGFKGVHWVARDKRWRAEITVDGRRKYLGQFDTPAAAHQAYISAGKALAGPFFTEN